MNPRLICFDLDGTLVDSRRAIVGCFQEALADHGVHDVDDAAIASHIGRPLEEMLEGLVPGSAQPPILDQYRVRFAHWDRSCSSVFPGVSEALATLRVSVDQMLITSSKTHRGIVRVLEEHGLEHHFDGLWGGDQVTRGKPHPQMLLRAMASVGVPPQQTLLVGDTSYDIEMAVAAGVRAVGVSWGMHPPERLLACGAVRVLEHGAELVTLVR